MTSDEFVAAIDELWETRTSPGAEDPQVLAGIASRVDELLEVSPFHPALLCFRADLVRLLYQEATSDLDEAVTALEIAHATTPRYAEPLLELGHCHHGYSEQADAAAGYFEHAQRLSLNELISALEGRIQVAIDVEQSDEARAFCIQIKKLVQLFADQDVGGEVAARAAEIEAAMERDLSLIDSEE